MKINGNYFGISRTVKESKSKSLLVKKYRTNSQQFKIDSVSTLFIDEVFIEKKWRSNNDLSINETGGFQLVIRTSKQLPDKYSFNWLFQLENGKKFNTIGDSNLVVDIGAQYYLDSITIVSYTGNVFYLDTSRYKYERHTFKIYEVN